MGIKSSDFDLPRLASCTGMSHAPLESITAPTQGLVRDPLRANRGCGCLKAHIP